MKFEEFKKQTMDRIENILDTGGRYLNPADRQFVSTLLSELEQFQYQAPKDRALMFHPLGGFQRYLIHKVTEVFPKLTSFSIGDDTTRRTVVCFKSKKKDQQMGLQQQHPGGSKTLPSNMKPDFSGRPPSRGRGDDGRVSGARSRDSSRNRKKENDYRSLPQQSKQSDSLSHIPKPLRSKKQATKKDMMKRSRSLQSSPVRMEEEQEQNGRSGRSVKKEQYEKRPTRSASLKPTSRRKERDLSPEEDPRPKKGNIKHNVSELSMERRYQGYRLEGKTVNGDCEDPYSCGDSESDHRVDGEVLRKDRERQRARLDKTRARQQSYESRSEESDASYRSRHEPQNEMPRHAKKTYIDSDLDLEDDPSVETQSLHSHLRDDSESDFDSGSDECPPAYHTVKRTASIKKAERNLDRIKRSSSHREESGSSSSLTSMNRASVSTVKKSPKISRSGRSATMPKSLKDAKKNGHHPHRSNTVKAPPRTTETTAIVERQPRSRTPHEATPRRKSTGSSARPKPKTQKETPSHKATKNHAASTDDFLEGSSSTLYLPLPENAKKSPSKKSKPVEKTKKESPKKSPAPKPTKKVVNATVCDGAAQTNFSGTLSRPRKERNKPEPTAPEIGSPSWNQPSPVDFMASMMQNMGLHGSSPYQSPQQQPGFNPSSFQQMMQSNQSFPPLPPHLMHQMYLSWIGAYYAGAAGTWPPPAPPNFMLPQGQQPPFDMSGFMGNFPRFPNPSEQGNPGQDEDEGKYYDEMYEPPTEPDNFQEFRAPDEDRESTTDPKYPYSVPDHLSSMSNDSEDIHDYTNPGFSSQPPVENGRHPHETDTSSVISSNKSEVAVESNPKGGVFIYVKSQSNSRASSIAGTHESADSLNTSDNVPSLVSTPRVSEHSHSSTKRKKTAPAKNAPGSRKNKGDSLNASHEEMILSLRRAPLATIDDDTDGFASTSQASSTTSLEREEEEEDKSSSSESEDSQDHDFVVVTAETTTPTADEETVVVEIKEASDEKAHSSGGSSSEQNVDENWPDPPPYSSVKEAVEGRNSTPSSTPNSTHSLANSTHSSTRDSTHSLANSTHSSTRSSTHSLANLSHHSESDVSKHSTKNSSLSLHSDASQHSDRSRHSNVSSHSNKSNSSKASSKHSGHHSDSSHKLSHHSSSSHHSSEDSDSSHDDDTHSNHDSANAPLKKDSSPSLSEGNNEDSDHGYDADQSRVEDKIDPSLENNLVKEMNGDIVVQDAQLDYYNFKPNQEQFEDKKYERFLEVYDFQPDMTDLNITSYLSKYRGLRLSRVDKTHALCIVPTTDGARGVLEEDFSNFQVRPLGDATTATQERAKTKLENDEFDAIRATRPKTSNTVAKRMIAGALGNSKFGPDQTSNAGKQRNSHKQSKKNKSEAK